MKKIHICQLLPRCDAGEEVAAAVNAGILRSPYQNVALNGEGYTRRHEVLITLICIVE